MSNQHSLKTFPEYFNAVENGTKPFEVRKNDRNYQVGDTLHLQEYSNGAYTGREIAKKICYILDNPAFCKDGYVVLGLANCIQPQKSKMHEQIEEMRKDLVEIFDEEYEKRRIITANFTAIKMTAKGYRKQIEGEWEIVLGSNGKEKMVCTKCRHGQDLHSTFTYCPNCGARMKGGE